MEAAAQIFEGKFDDVGEEEDDDGDVHMHEPPTPQQSRTDISKRKAALVNSFTPYLAPSSNELMIFMC